MFADTLYSILFKITATSSGKHNNILIKSIIMYIYKNQSNVHFVL